MKSHWRQGAVRVLHKKKPHTHNLPQIEKQKEKNPNQPTTKTKPNQK